jgi:hypothetical protein
MPQRVDSSPILEDWAPLVPAGRRMLAMPDSEDVVLTGTLFGDRRFPDGTCVVTSCVVELDPVGGIARTGSTRYRLGGPSCVFRRWMEEHGHLLADFVRRVPAIEREDLATYAHDSHPSRPLAPLRPRAQRGLSSGSAGERAARWGCSSRRTRLRAAEGPIAHPGVALEHGQREADGVAERGLRSRHPHLGLVE